MKYLLYLMLFLWVLPPVYAINNRIYFNGMYGLAYQGAAEPYQAAQAHYIGANIGWHGVFNSKQQGAWNSGFGSYNFGVLSEAGYYHYVDKNSNNTDLGSVKVSAGISMGQYCVWYVKPTLFYELDTEAIGLSTSIGLKINAFINKVALAFGIGSDIPIPGVGNGMYHGALAGFYITFDMVYDINRAKK